MFKKNAVANITFSLVNATTGAPLTGATVSGFRCLDAAAQAGVSGTITEKGNGQYNFAAAAADLNGNDCGFLFTATNAVPVNLHIHTTAADVTNAASLGLTNLDAAISSRMATFTYTTPPTAAAIRAEMDANSTKLAHLDVDVSTRLAAASYTAPDNTGIGAAATSAASAATASQAARTRVELALPAFAPNGTDGLVTIGVGTVQLLPANGLASINVQQSLGGPPDPNSIALALKTVIAFLDVAVSSVAPTDPWGGIITAGQAGTLLRAAGAALAGNITEAADHSTTTTKDALDSATTRLTSVNSPTSRVVTIN